jgi:Protein of unknown function (DUF2840)
VRACYGCRASKVERALQLIDVVEALGVDPADAAPDYWHHVHNRLSVNETPRPYTRSRRQAWLHRRRVTSRTPGVRYFLRQLLRQAFSFPQSGERHRITYGTHQTAFRSAFIVFKLRRASVTELVAVQPLICSLRFSISMAICRSAPRCSSAYWRCPDKRSAGTA